MSQLPRAKGELFRYADPAACVAFEYNLCPDELEGRGDVNDEKIAATTSEKIDVAPASTAASTPEKKTKLAVVAVGGLTDGFFALPYLPHLAELLRDHNENDEGGGVEWSLITPLLSSCHSGWGTSSLDRDAGELLELSVYLRAHRGVQGVALLGHSTGCQDAVRYAERARERKDPAAAGNDRAAAAAAPLLGVVLQAPVSDRECFFLDPETAPLAQRRLDRCREAAREQGQKYLETTVIDFMSEWDGAPLSAKRWLSLAEKGGDDDYFSSDFSDSELSERLRALGEGGVSGEDVGGGGGGTTAAIPTLIISSLREEYLPKDYDTAAHGRRLAKAINRLRRSKGKEAEEGEEKPLPTAEAVALDGDHALRGAESEAARVIFDFLSTNCRMSSTI
jgi:pimeloyl-ACP methyl ester carboxylesterase